MTSTSVNERTRRVSRITLWAMMAVAAVTWLLFLTVAGSRISGKRNTGAAVVTHVAEDHHLYVNGCTPG